MTPTRTPTMTPITTPINDNPERSTRREHRFLLTSLVLGCLSASALAQSEAPKPASDSAQPVTTASPESPATPDGQAKVEDAMADPTDKLEVKINLGLWATSVSGTVAVRDRSASMSSSFIDIVQESDSVFGFTGLLEIGKGPISGYLNGVYMRVGVNDAPSNVGPVDITNEMGIVDFGLRFQLGEWRLGDLPRTPSGPLSGELATGVWSLDLNVGGRYFGVSLDLDSTQGLGSKSDTEEWVDPIVGTRLNFDISREWSVVVGGDIGGFGAASKFTWQASVMASYHFYVGSCNWSFDFGYRALGDNRDNLGPAGGAEFDIILYGPAIGFTVQF